MTVRLEDESAISERQLHISAGLRSGSHEPKPVQERRRRGEVQDLTKAAEVPMLPISCVHTNPFTAVSQLLHYLNI
jgi:hypothetical protein